MRTSAILAIAGAVAAAPAAASSPLPGATGAFERDYLEFILDHHYSGLRATELAAGTAAVGPTVPPGPWPADPASFPTTLAKATDPVALDVAVRSNMAQEKEINEGETFLRDWYGYTTELNIPPMGAQLLSTLEAAAPGDPFNIAFLTNFSDHHVMAIERSNDCLRRAGHAELRAYCRMIATAQVKDVREMRQQLQDRYGITVEGPLPSVVPEPGTWAMMIAGFGLVGGAMRRRRTAAEA